MYNFLKTFVGKVFNNSKDPLIYTSKGNLPESSLVYDKSWEISSQQIVFSDWYTLNGEVVKKNVHIYSNPTVSSLVHLGDFHG